MSWFINVVEPIELKIDRNNAYIIVGDKRLGVGTYNVKKGTNLTLVARAYATGSNAECKYARIMWVNELDNSVVASNEGRICGGGYINVSKSVVVNSKMKLKVVLQYRDEHGVWVTVDTYGC